MIEIRAKAPAIVLLLLATVAILSVFFGPVLWGGQVYYPGDTARVYLPQQSALGRSLTRGALPWWTADLGAGYPLLAEGQTGALYPPNLLLHRLLPPLLVITASIVLHYLLAGAGLAYFARRCGLSTTASYWGAIVFCLGGFGIAHLSHISVLATMAWLPWMLALTRALLQPRIAKSRWMHAGGLVLVSALQFLAGHPQISLLNLMAVFAYAVWLSRCLWHERVLYRRSTLWLGCLLASVIVGALQLLPTLQLSALSQRAGGLDSAFFTSYSFHPALLMTYVSPFALGNPYPTGSVELMVYAGLMPLALSGIALRERTPDDKWFFFGLAVAGLVLAFGRWNPLYSYLRYVPILNLFRVPARYLFWSSFGLALLSAMGLDRLRTMAASRTTQGGALLMGIAVAVCASVFAIVRRSPGVEQLIDAWQWIPLAIVAAMSALLLSTRLSGRRAWQSVALLILLVDLYAYGAVLGRTYNATWPAARAMERPRSLELFNQDPTLYRVYTKEEILPALSVMRESLYPNMGLTYDVAGAGMYMPLVPRAYQDYLSHLTAERLNRLNVKYYVIPQLLPVDRASELYDVENPISALPVHTWLDLSEEATRIQVTEVDVESYLSHAADLPTGSLVAELLLRDEKGNELAIPLRAGIETSEWAYDRDDVRATVAHRAAPIASTWPARSGFPPRDHVGHTYLARQPLEAVLRPKAVMLRTVIDEAFVRVERVRLRDVTGKEYLLSHLLGLGDHSIVYRSEDALIYRNEDVLPRAYLVSADQVRIEAGEPRGPWRSDSGSCGACASGGIQGPARCPARVGFADGLLGAGRYGLSRLASVYRWPGSAPAARGHALSSRLSRPWRAPGCLQLFS